MKKGRIVLGTTSIRYTLKTAREAASAYNRIAGFMAVSQAAGRLTIEQIVSGQTSPLFKGDLDALVVFMHHGHIHADDTLQAYDDMETLLGHYVRPADQGGKGGELLDFYEPIVEALIKCGVMERAAEEDDAVTVGVAGAAVRPPVPPESLREGESLE